MKRILAGIALATVLALGYVQQRIWLISLGYQVENLRSVRDELLDQHRVLGYNVLALQSPVILDKRLARQDVLLTPPKAIEILPPRSSPHPSGLVIPSGLVQPESSWWKQALREGARWLENGRQAIAEPARGEQ